MFTVAGGGNLRDRQKSPEKMTVRTSRRSSRFLPGGCSFFIENIDTSWRRVYNVVLPVASSLISFWCFMIDGIESMLMALALVLGKEEDWLVRQVNSIRGQR
tara:strand:+ start:614 stop:919 length:306 start_codon:yes stop_codon:yes gene_type:complete